MIVECFSGEIMDADVEDGEVLDSDDENKPLCKNDELPKKFGFSAASIWHGVPVSGGGSELGYMETLTNSIVKNRRIPEGLPTSESENDENDSECSDSERPNKKSRAFCNNVARSVGACSAAGNSCPGNLKLGLNKSRKNNVWATVIQDQLLSNDLMGWSGLEQAVESDRDVESYNYLKAKEIKEMTQSTPAAFLERQQVDPGVPSEAVPDISEMETFGTAPSKKAARPDDKSPGNKDCEPGRQWLKRTHNGNPRGSVHSRIGPRSFSEISDFSDIKVTSSDAPSAVADELIRVLKEPETMKETFDRVVLTIGADSALKFLHDTEDIERNGGLMTMDGRRRRTPGGVYLFLVKSGVTKEQGSAIFQNQREDVKHHKKQWRAKQKRMMLERNRQVMEQALGLQASSKPPEDAAAVSSAVTAVRSDGPPVKADQPLEMEEEDGLDPFDPSINIELG